MKDDITGSTFTISSLGGIGGTDLHLLKPSRSRHSWYFKSKKSCKVENESFVEKTILPFSLSYDHRVINGVDAGNFMNFTVQLSKKVYNLM